jgi:hypothetical protein
MTFNPCADGGKGKQMTETTLSMGNSYLGGKKRGR